MTTTYHITDIRNVALAGHGASGKTSLADALLFAAGATSRKGSVDDGTSILDVDEEEKRRHFTIDCHLGHLAWTGKASPPDRHAGLSRLHRQRAQRPGGRRERGPRRLRPVRHRGEHAPALPRGRPAGTRPVRGRHQDGRRERRFPLGPRGDPRPRSARSASRSTCRSARVPRSRGSSTSSSRTTRTRRSARCRRPRPTGWSSSRSSSSTRT